METHKSDSSEQQEAETYILKTLEKTLQADFDSNAQLPIEANIDPDAVDPTNNIVVEVYSRIGRVKGGQRQKIKSDVLKLALIGEQVSSEWRRILCFASEEAASYVKGDSWVTSAVQHFGVEVQIVPLSDEHHRQVVEAQERQQMINPE